MDYWTLPYLTLFVSFPDAKHIGHVHKLSIVHFHWIIIDGNIFKISKRISLFFEILRKDFKLLKSEKKTQILTNSFAILIRMRRWRSVSRSPNFIFLYVFQRNRNYMLRAVETHLTESLVCSSVVQRFSN